MKKGYIKIPINEVWEITNKPHRFFRSLYEEVEKLELGEYQLLYFSQDEKNEIIKRIKEVNEVFNNRWRKIPSEYYKGFEDGYAVAKRNYKKD